MVINKRAMVRLGTVLTAAALALPLLSAVPAQASAKQSSLPRNQTLITSGTEYGAPTAWNPLDSGTRYTGTMGLLYEPLFLYDPIHNDYIPWLATGGQWTSATVYTITVRSGVTWTDGSALTSADVAYSIGLALTNKAVPYSNLAVCSATTGCLKSATASGNTVKVTFSSPAPYAAWQNYLWNNPVLPSAVWSKLSPAAQVTGNNATGIVSSGPMTLDAAATTSTEACYQDNPGWWATKALGLSFHFEYLCDIVNGSNNVELTGLLADNIDWSNNFLPGINDIMATGGESQIKTYYPTAPYMLSANTAWLEMNTSKAPFNNLNFRKAVAYAIDPQQIVTDVYGGIVAAANPTGLLPNLDSYIDSSVVKADAFTYNQTMAKAFLAKSGYKGAALTIEVPDGWTDWMAAIDNISTQLDAVGIKVSPIYPSANARTADMTNGTFDMLIDNNAGPSSDPWSYFDRVFQLPIGTEEASGLNVERFSDSTAWALVQKAAATPPSQTTTLKGIYSQLEANFLQNLPEVPLWYNGAWFQGNNTTWKNYPSSLNSKDQNTPVMWGGWLGADTTVFALADLRAA
jgi:peptide/nickel transport system substrate-binding protein